jgi:hypothetical protein
MQGGRRERWACPARGLEAWRRLRPGSEMDAATIYKHNSRGGWKFTLKVTGHVQLRGVP